jgi:hypothetical protein
MRRIPSNLTRGWIRLLFVVGRQRRGALKRISPAPGRGARGLAQPLPSPDLEALQRPGAGGCSHGYPERIVAG